jgi:UDP-N-acetylmuramyl pentapeptide phosphotransferase/UDP-N-acetylglucosamine-1-phosphate transferase
MLQDIYIYTAREQSRKERKNARAASDHPGHHRFHLSGHKNHLAHKYQAGKQIWLRCQTGERKIHTRTIPETGGLSFGIFIVLAQLILGLIYYNHNSESHS